MRSFAKMEIFNKSGWSILRQAVVVASCTVLLTTSANALADTNSNGMSDVWERQHNYYNLFPPTFDPQADADGDRASNLDESIAGTDPFDGKPPVGYFQAQVTHVPATYITGQNSNPELFTPEACIVSWPTLIGKQYTLLFSPDLAAGSWLPVDEPMPGTGLEIQVGIVPTQQGGTRPDKLFWRVAVSDIDTDGDHFTDWEETQKGTDPQIADRDDDGLPDAWEIAHGLDPDDDGSTNPDNGANGDPDGDGISNAAEKAADTKPDVAADFPIHLIKVRKAASGHSTESTPGSDTPYSGSHRWGAEWTDTAPTEEIVTNAAITPEYLKADLDGVTFPALPPAAGATTALDLSNIADISHSWQSSDGHNLSGVLASSRFWIKASACQGVRNFGYLRVKRESVWNSVSHETAGQIVSVEPVNFIIPANGNLSNEADAEPLPSLIPGSVVHTIESLVRISIKDNVPATGVDDVSITARNDPDSGYQANFWIMAPCGDTVTIDGTDHDLSNNMHFNMPMGLPTPFEMTCEKAAPNPASTNLDNTQHGLMVSWKGTTSETSDNTPVFKILGETVALPIRVKVMKKRTVKVAVWSVRHHSTANPVMPNAAFQKAVRDRLNEIFGSQINAWFEVNFHPEETFDYTDGDLHFGQGFYTIRHGSKEKEMIDACDDGNADINLYLIKDVSYLSAAPSDPLAVKKSGSSYPWKFDNPGKYANHSVVNLSQYSTVPEGADEVLSTIAHEIGHLMVGPGHPDQFDPGDAGSGGLAPLPGLAPVEYRKRLMFSTNGFPLLSKLLVKSEWDEAEDWLDNFPDKQN